MTCIGLFYKTYKEVFKFNSDKRNNLTEIWHKYLNKHPTIKEVHMEN